MNYRLQLCQRFQKFVKDAASSILSTNIRLCMLFHSHINESLRDSVNSVVVIIIVYFIIGTHNVQY